MLKNNIKIIYYIDINMSDKIQSEFNDILNKLKDYDIDSLSSLSDLVKLDFYKYYKQSTIGDCNIEKPWAIYYKQSAKWDAWNSVKGMDVDEAKEMYIKNYYEFIS